MKPILLLCALFGAQVAVAQVPSTAQTLSGDELQKLHQRTDAYLDSVQRHPDWLLSRLQMYWHSHATDVYVQGETFSHAGGDRAPVPTVKFNGTRSHGSAYDRPSLADVVPYDDDDNSSVTFINKTTRQQEKTHPSKTGCNIASLNQQILRVARDAARLYAHTGDVRYARMAHDVFDTFVQGIYFRHVPTDLTHGHMQTLVGMTTFEVIHEDAIVEVTEMYPLLQGYEPFRQRQTLYDQALKKWADNIVANGVPHNNWNLIQANYLVRIALVLQPDQAYDDRHGRDYYLDCVLYRSSLRQWSVQRLADYGFDPDTHIWCESPGYSVNVVKDYVTFANTIDLQTGIDMFAQLPVIEKAVFALPQYLFPNRMICGFGDTHPNYLSLQTVDTLMEYARRRGKSDLLARLEQLRAAIVPGAPASALAPYVSPTFYSPNVSWLVQRTGMDTQRDLMISVNAALGNHQHADGMNRELSGRGYVLGTDAGSGKVLYSGADYHEYYSRFPAHNTVCVDGVSDHAVMMSQHPFEVQMLQHTSGATVSQVAFVEPETQSDQLRTNGIIQTPNGGYYVDIFRSRRRNGRDKFHDYFYHNLGQRMTLTAADGTPLPLQPTEELAFAGGHLYAYSYIYDKHSAETSNDVRATFTTA